jgi:autotransporter passenger strand-loop-strand repeat protein
VLSGAKLTSGTYDIAVEKLSGPDPGLIKVTLGHSSELAGVSGSIVGANAGTVHGHTLASGVIVAGAADYTTTPAFSGGTVNTDFSASGVGTELLFDQNGNPLAPPQVLSPVGITGVDNMAISWAPKGFTGTSAAAPTIAAIAALMKQANPNLTPQQANEILQATAFAMPNPATAGAGLAVASVAIAAALALQTVSGGQVSSVTSSTSSVFIVSSGGTLKVLAGGAASAATIDSGGSGVASSGGVLSGAHVNSGGALDLQSSGIASNTTVAPSGVLNVESGGSAVGGTVYGVAGWLPASGGSAGPGADYVPVTASGTVSVFSGGTISNMTVSSGGLLVLAGGATHVNNVILSGGMEEFVSGSASQISRRAAVGSISPAPVAHSRASHWCQAAPG